MADELPLFSDPAWQPKAARAAKAAAPWCPGIFDLGILKVQRHATTFDTLYGYPSWSVYFLNGSRWFFEHRREPRRIWSALPHAGSSSPSTAAKSR